MQAGNSRDPNSDVSARLALLRSVESGVLDSIPCPQCHSNSVSVWFTHPSLNEYRTWFVCSRCAFQMRVQNSERPAYFSADRVDARLEEYDSEILRKCRLADSPPQNK